MGGWVYPSDTNFIKRHFRIRTPSCCRKLSEAGLVNVTNSHLKLTLITGNAIEILKYRYYLVAILANLTEKYRKNKVNIALNL